MDLFGYLDFDLFFYATKTYLICGIVMFVVTFLHQSYRNGPPEPGDIALVLLMGAFWPLGYVVWIAYFESEDKKAIAAEQQRVVEQLQEEQRRYARLSRAAVQPMSQPIYDTETIPPDTERFGMMIVPNPRRRRKKEPKEPVAKKPRVKKPKFDPNKFQAEETPPHLM